DSLLRLQPARALCAPGHQKRQRNQHGAQDQDRQVPGRLVNPAWNAMINAPGAGTSDHIEKMIRQSKHRGNQKSSSSVGTTPNETLDWLRFIRLRRIMKPWLKTSRRPSRSNPLKPASMNWRRSSKNWKAAIFRSNGPSSYLNAG